MSRLSRWIAVVSVLLLIGVFLPAKSPSFEAYDPASNKPDGLKATVLLAQKLGATTDSGSIMRGNGTAFLPVDNLTAAETNDLERWVRTGGTLVLADPNSSLSPWRVGGDSNGQPRQLVSSCASPLVQGVGRIQPSNDRYYPVYAVSDGSAGCFPAVDGQFMASQRLGLGSIVSIGTPDVFTNRQLGKVDNSVLAGNLLNMSPGNSITMLHTGDVTASGTENLSDLVPHSVKEMFWQLAIAAVLLAIWRSRRLGMPVLEPQPVAIESSQLVVASGNLMQTAEHVDEAAYVLRADLRRLVAGRIGMPIQTDGRILAQAAADRSGIDSRLLHYTLVDQPIATDKDLVTLAQMIEDVYREITHAR